ncbi:hypothetical protein ACFRKB_28995 [Streptomyces scopuliridis]|uniref:hypothetical protein n=1 Tax=Streptomyces scopuliridis TaxID=452529 RepID=UPI00369C8230
MDAANNRRRDRTPRAVRRFSHVAPHWLVACPKAVDGRGTLVLDAVGGAMAVGAGFGLAYVFQGPRARTRIRGAVAGSSPEPVKDRTSG